MNIDVNELIQIFEFIQQKQTEMQILANKEYQNKITTIKNLQNEITRLKRELNNKETNEQSKK
jgi:uncharacterized small protein (DUF1192 family)